MFIKSGRPTYLVNIIDISILHIILVNHLDNRNYRCYKWLSGFNVKLPAQMRALYLDTSDLSFLSEMPI